jgi:preprotein translocase subunit SecA
MSDGFRSRRLARIDRRVFVELDHSDGVQVVKVPVSDAVWSTWRRYCDALDLTMGQAVAGLIGHELGTVVGDVAEGRAFDVEQASRERKEQLDLRERDLSDRAAQLRRTEELLREREARMLRKAAEAAGARIVTKVGRNEPCPCGSGLKFKRCHGQS